jgi:hypothetical protein
MDTVMTDTFDFKGEVVALEPSYRGSSVAQNGDAGDTADLWEWRKQPQLTSEPTAAEAGHVKVFSGLDMSELTAPGSTGQSGGVQSLLNDGSVRSDEGPEETVAFYYTKIPDQTFDDLAVDPTNPNTGHTPEWSNLRSGDPGLPAVQKDDTFDFTTEPTEPTEPTATPTAHETQRLIVGNAGNGGLAHFNTDDGGIIIDYTPGPDDNDGFLIINWLAEDHVDPSDPSDDLKPTESLIADYAEPTAHHPMYPTFDVVGSPTEII